MPLSCPFASRVLKFFLFFFNSQDPCAVCLFDRRADRWLRVGRRASLERVIGIAEEILEARRKAESHWGCPFFRNIPIRGSGRRSWTRPWENCEFSVKEKQARKTKSSEVRSLFWEINLFYVFIGLRLSWPCVAVFMFLGLAAYGFESLPLCGLMLGIFKGP